MFVDRAIPLSIVCSPPSFFFFAFFFFFPLSEKDDDGKSQQDGGIRLGKLKKTGEKHKSTVATFDEHDILKMKNGVQNVVKAAAPLGKCMDYIPDDLSKHGVS